MALTTAEQLKLAKIFGATPTMMAAHITSLGATVTADLEADIRAELDRWDEGTGINTVWFTATESNEGFNQSGNPIGGNPIRNLAYLLEWPFPVGPMSMGTLQIG